MKKIHCKICGTLIDEDSNFCCSCGQNLKSNEKEEINFYANNFNEEFEEYLTDDSNNKDEEKIIEGTIKEINMVLYMIGNVFMFFGIAIMFSSFLSGLFLILFSVSLFPAIYKFIRVNALLIRAMRIAFPIAFFILAMKYL